MDRNEFVDSLAKIGLIGSAREGLFDPLLLDYDSFLPLLNELKVQVEESQEKLDTIQENATYNENTDMLDEGGVNKYFLESRALDSKLSSLSLSSGSSVISTDSLLQAIGKLQTQFYRRASVALYYLVTDGDDWAPAFARAFAAGVRVVWVPRGDYGINSTVFMPAGVFIQGDSRVTTFYPKSSGAFVGGFMFQQNTTNGTTWSTPYPNMNSGGMSKCRFDNRENVPAIRGFQTFASSRFEELSFTGYRQAISKPAGYYIDSVTVRDVICENPQDNTEYQVSVVGLGDGFYAQGLHFPYTVATSSSILGLNLRGCNGGIIDASIGGDYLIELCSSVSINNGHFERSQHIYDSSSVSSPSIFLPDTRIPVITKGTAASANNESRYVVDLTNIIFRNVEGLMEWSGYHVQVGTSVQLVTKNSCQEWSVQGDLQRCQRAGIRICQSDGITSIPTFNNYSYLTSKDSFVNIPYRVDLNHFVRCFEASFTGLSPASVRTEVVGERSSGVLQWRIPTGTYYYNCQIIYDSARAIGRSPTNTEISVSVTDTGKMVVINTAFGNKPVTGILRVYRGTSPGVYNGFVDIHTIGSTWLHDNGVALNGVVWVDRTAGAMSSINSMGEHVKFLGSTIDFECSAFPSVAGSWTKGDKVYRTDSTLDSNNMLLLGHYRATTGTGQVLGTDWVNMRVSHLSPAM